MSDVRQVVQGGSLLVQALGFSAGASPQVRLVNPLTGAVAIAASGTGILEGSPGNYAVEMAIPAALAVDDYAAEWQFGAEWFRDEDVIRVSGRVVVPGDLLKDRLKEMVAWDDEPTLTEDQLDDLLARARRADSCGNPALPAARRDTFYQLEQAVIPAGANGHLYVCEYAGITASGEPAWPTGSSSTVTDGEVVWRERGLDAWTPTFDLNAAAAAAWRLKAGKAAGRITFSTDGQRFERAQVHAHCMQMAASYARRTGSTIVTRRPQ